MFQTNKTKVSEGNQKMIGVSSFKVLDVNPTRSELNKILGKKDTAEDKEIEYVSVSQQGNKYTRINFILEETETKRIYFLNFFLEKRENTNKEGTKKEFINNAGITAWTDENNNLPEWFTQKSIFYREAFVGEGDLYKFLKAWLSLHKWSSNENLFDIQLLLKNNVKEFKGILADNDPENDVKTPVIANIVITSRVVNKTDESGNTVEETVFFEEVYNKEFLSGQLFEQYKLTPLSFPIEIDSSEKYAMRAIKYFARTFDPDAKYPVKALSTIKILSEFDPKDYLASSPETMASVDTENQDTDEADY